MPEAEPPTRMFGGRLLLRQPRTGHRAGTDAILLAAAALPEPGTAFVDLGAGVGTVGLALALREPTATGRLVEQSAEVAVYARDNVTLNGMEARVGVECLDILDRSARAALAGQAALAVTNPPFYLPGTGRASPNAARAAAHMMPAGTGERANGHAAWLLAALSFLAPHGVLVMINRPEALAALLQASAGRLGGLAVRPVHAKAGEPAIRILFGGVVGSRAPLTILPPLLLHRADGTFTDEAEALAGGDRLPLVTSKKKPARSAGFQRS